MPKGFNSYFDWKRYEVLGDGEGAFSTQDHKSIFTTAARFVGYEKLLIETPSLDEITDVYLKWNMRLLSHWGNKLVYFIIGDDIAHKDNLFLSPEKLREWYFPQLKRLVDLALDYNLTVIFHSDGKISSILYDLYEMGIDALLVNGDDLSELESYGKMKIIRRLPHMTPRVYNVLREENV